MIGCIRKREMPLLFAASKLASCENSRNFCRSFSLLYMVRMLIPSLEMESQESMVPLSVRTESFFV